MHHLKNKEEKKQNGVTEMLSLESQIIPIHTKIWGPHKNDRPVRINVDCPGFVHITVWKLAQVLIQGLQEKPHMFFIFCNAYRTLDKG